MKILVCVKPNITGQELGPHEAVAVEAGLRLKDGDRDCRVDVITVGPARWDNVLQRALGMGADHALHVLTAGGEEGADGLVPPAMTARLLARALTRPGFAPGYDLILTGVMSQDLMAGAVGPMMAMALGLPLATAVVRVRHEAGRLRCVRDWEGGMRETLELPVPVLVTIQAGHYVPRYPSLSNILKAATVASRIIAAAGLGLAEMEPDAVFLAPIEPATTRAGRLVGGGIQDQVSIFTSFLQERALL